MRWLCAVAICVISWPLSVQAQDEGHFKGIIIGLTKAQNAPTGTITLVSSTGQHHKFLVTEFTAWETVQGKTVKPTSFLGEHRGQHAEVFFQKGTTPSAAT